MISVYTVLPNTEQVRYSNEDELDEPTAGDTLDAATYNQHGHVQCRGTYDR